MDLMTDGVELVPVAFAPDQMRTLEEALPELPQDRPGTRLRAATGLAERVRPATAIARSVLGPATRPVRAILFDKSPKRNWSLGWHQDRTIAVRRRIATPGFSEWTLKSGIDHVVPPFSLLERMLTVRIHLDLTGADNAPLLIVPGSHRLARIKEPEISSIVDRLGVASCEAERGDIWLYATPILHASGRAVRPARRRVLQLLYSADELPGALEWLGI